MGSLMAGWDSPVLGDDKKGTTVKIAGSCCCMRWWLLRVSRSVPKLIFSVCLTYVLRIAHARRNRSLTKEEVEAFWKQRRNPEDGGELTSPLASPAKVSPFGSLEKKARSSSPASSPTRVRVDGFLPTGGYAAAGDDSPSKSRDWWTRSSWAFLNEPPQEEPSVRAQSYTPQFHVARIATGDA